MTISTKGRYALRIIIDLAENDNGSYIPMKQVAERQGLSLKYLEHILSILKQKNLVEGLHGKGGGYKLTKKPEEYTVGEILRLVEGDLAPVACLECGAKPCENVGKCRTIKMWRGLHNLIEEYFDGITVRDLMQDDTDPTKKVDKSFLAASL
ncbi:MAG: RrF2 family transcriptional regulator [Clostridia bacterium]|nr:RrF2 family transcriptional regulator [Clostridia bacterium]